MSQPRSVGYTYKCANRLYWRVEATRYPERKEHSCWSIVLYRSGAGFRTNEEEVLEVTWQGQYQDPPLLSDCILALNQRWSALAIGVRCVW